MKKEGREMLIWKILLGLMIAVVAYVVFALVILLIIPPAVRDIAAGRILDY